MIKDPLPQELTRQALLDVSLALAGIAHFPFFGTLLGLARDGDTIDNDDDIDIYVNHRDRARVLDAMSGTDFQANFGEFPNRSRSFAQFHRDAGGHRPLVDFYFYEIDEARGIIVDRWNYRGEPDVLESNLHVPARMVFPLRPAAGVFARTVQLPVRPWALCAFLYGESLRIPMRKRTDYRTRIVDHRPVVVLKDREARARVRHPAPTGEGPGC